MLFQQKTLDVLDSIYKERVENQRWPLENNKNVLQLSDEADQVTTDSFFYTFINT